MTAVFANRSQKHDFIQKEIERLGTPGKEIFIAVAFFTDASVVERLLDKGCKVDMVVRLGFPTSPAAIRRVMAHEHLKLRVYTGRSFHPKLYIFGDEAALVGSANLTHSAIMSNQEVVVSIDGDDDRFADLAAVFQEYWDHADPCTKPQLDLYSQLYRTFEFHENAAEKVAIEAASRLGNTAPPNIDRGGARRTQKSLFVPTFRRAYQEAVAAFNIVRRVYESTGYRKASEEEIPLRLEIDSFIDFVRDTECPGESWKAAPLRSESEQGPVIQQLIQKWSKTRRPHFEDDVVGVNYPRLRRVFSSVDSIKRASDDELFDALCTLHSFHDRLRFFDGGLPTLKKVFIAANEPGRARESLAYLVFGLGDLVERMANMVYDPDTRLREFGRANVQELVGWMNHEQLPVINGRTTKVLRFLGSNVRQLQ